MTQMPAADPWRILGIARGADPADIRAAYRRLALVHHPDHGGSARHMAAINRAYAALRSARSTSPASTARGGWSSATSAHGPASRPAAVRRRPGIWECRAGQWLLVLITLCALGTLWATRQAGALLLVGALSVLVAIADRRPAGTSFHPADDAVDAVAALLGWALRVLAGAGLSGRR